ncbi:hypothetical protein O4G76_20540, partial [Limimaricola sp. G21655-S1]|nr:hypothetical protein [Limimaricola sp. G21655-S1]
ARSFRPTLILIFATNKAAKLAAFFIFVNNLLDKAAVYVKNKTLSLYLLDTGIRDDCAFFTAFCFLLIMPKHD